MSERNLFTPAQDAVQQASHAAARVLELQLCSGLSQAEGKALLAHLNQSHHMAYCSHLLLAGTAPGMDNPHPDLHPCAVPAVAPVYADRCAVQAGEIAAPLWPDKGSPAMDVSLQCHCSRLLIVKSSFNAANPLT